MKTARFAELVKVGGVPRIHLPWTPPLEDIAFRRALKEHRVLTVRQVVRGSKKDQGQVGFHEEPNAQFLVFPKSIRAYAGQRIVGINYDLLDAEADRSPRVGAVQPAKKSARPLPRSSPRGKAKESSKVVVFIPPASEREKTTTPPATRQRDVEPERPSRRTAGAAPASGQPDVTPKSGQGKDPPGAAGPAVTERRRARRTTTAAKAVSDATSRTQPERGADASAWRVEVKRALRELKAGRTVVAYERLQALARSDGA